MFDVRGSVGMGWVMGPKVHLAVGWVGLGQLFGGLGWAESMKIDPRTTLSESPPQKRSGMACVLKGFHSFTCTPTCSSANGMSHTCLCLPSYNWYSFTDPGGMEG